MSNLPSTKWREQVIFNEMMMLCTRPTRGDFYRANSLKHNSPRVEMSVYLDTLSIFRANNSFLLPL